MNRRLKPVLDSRLRVLSRGEKCASTSGAGFFFAKMTTKRKPAKRGTTSKKTAVTVEPFVVPVDWMTITVTVEREDIEYLIATNHAGSESLGIDVWHALYSAENTDALREASEGHADVGDPVEIKFIQEKLYWDDITRVCEAAKMDVGSAIRLAIFNRCCRIRKFIKREKRRKTA